MDSTKNTGTTRLVAALGAAGAAAVAPVLLFAGSATAHADDCYDGSLAGSYYCSPASGAGIYAPTPVYQAPAPPPDQILWGSLPGCSGGVLEALDGEC